MKKSLENNLLESRDTAKIDSYVWSYNIDNNNNIVITGISPKPVGLLEIPDKISSYNVLSIGNNAFANCSEITSVIFSRNITSIGSAAFLGCTGLLSVNIPSTINTINTSTFTNCTNLKNIDIPESITGIGRDAFLNCNDNISVNIHNLNKWCNTTINIETYCASPLHKNSAKLTLDKNELTGEIEITVANRICPYALHNCDKITSLSIYGNPVEIGIYAFENCRSLSNLSIPDSIIDIYQNAFSNCNDDIFIIGADNIKYLPIRNTANYWLIKYTRYGPAHENLVIKDNTTKIARNAFANFNSIDSLTIPETVSRVNSNAFSNCQIASVYIYNLSTWCTTDRGDSANPATYSNRLLSLDNSSPDPYNNCQEIPLSGHFSIPDGITRIGQHAFSYHTKLSSVSFPSSVTQTGAWTFYHDNELVSVYIPQDGNLTSIGIGMVRECVSLPSIEIPPGVTSIGQQAFSGCLSLSSIGYDNVLPSGLRTIEFSLFANCDSLSNITIQDEVTSIGGAAFRDCDNLVSVTLGNSITSINSEAFYSCDNLLSIEFPNSLINIGENSFAFCPELTSIIFGNNLSIIGNTAFKSCNKLSTADFPNSLAIIGISSFTDCSELTSIYLGDNVEKIGSNAFKNCIKLQKINDTNTIPDKITKLEEGVFYNCDELSDIIILDNIKIIDKNVFYDCNNLVSVSIGNGVTEIGNNAFYNCNSLVSVILGNSITNVGNNAFYNCSSLVFVDINNFRTWCEIEFGNFDANPLFYAQHLYLNGEEINLNSLVIPKNTKKIGNYVFYSCPLVSVMIPSTVKTIGDYSFAESTSLETVITENKIDNIGKYAFKNCTNLNILYAGGIIKNVAEGAFYNCSNLSLFKSEDGDPVLIIDENDIYFYPEREGYDRVNNPVYVEKLFDSEKYNDYSIENTGQFTIGSDGSKIFTSFIVRHKKEYAELPHLTYSGANTNINTIEFDTEVPEISSTNYGRCDYENVTKTVVTDENNIISSSADRFKSALAVIEQPIPIDGNTKLEAENPVCKIYNLNSDASYIALYPGLSGLSRLWAVELYKNSREEKSIELLGYTNEKISSFETKLKSSLLSIEDGSFINVDPTVIAEKAYRVHEDYISSRFLQIHTNLNDLHDTGSFISFVVALSAPNSFTVSADNIDRYNALLYNRGRGSVFPIYTGPLRDISSETERTYISTQTKADDYYFKNESLLAGIELTGTPNVFNYTVGDAYVPAVETNSFFNISSLNIDFLNGNPLSVRFIFNKLYLADYILNANSLFFAVYDNSVAEYEDYHYFLHHPTVWPYDKYYKCEFSDNNNGNVFIRNYSVSCLNLSVDQIALYNNNEYRIESWSNTDNTIKFSSFDPNNGFINIERFDAGWPPDKIPEDSIGLSMDQISSLDDIPYIKSGSMAFKMNEEYDLDPELESYPVNLATAELYKAFAAVGDKNLMELSSAFDLSNTFIFEIEKPKALVSLLDKEILVPVYASLKTQHIVTHPSLASARLFNGSISSIAAKETSNISAFYIPEAEMPPPQQGYTPYMVTENDLKDFLKIYVNYSYDEDNDITLYFNYNNYFHSPYVLHRDSGIFCTHYKPETYLKLKRGESGVLTIVTQLQYIDGYGDIRGAKDLPLLTYKIWNVSDDKPKFVIKNKWVIDDATFEATRGEPVGENFDKFELKIGSNKFISEERVKNDYTTSLNASLNSKVELTKLSTNVIPSHVKTLTYDLVYDFSDEYFQFEKASDSVYSDKGGRIRISTTNFNHELTFNLNAGAALQPVDNTDYCEKDFWLDIINPSVELENGAVVSGEENIQIKSGCLSFRFKKPDNSDTTDLLAKEDSNNGYIFNDKDMPIEVFYKKG